MTKLYVVIYIFQISRYW